MPSPRSGSPADRVALADLIHAHREEIKEAFRARFAATGVGFYDSSDFFATVLRRADLLTARLGPMPGDIARLLREIMVEALRDYARSALSERRLRREIRERARTDHPGPDEPTADSDDLLRLHLSPDEMNLARLRANGMRHTLVAAALGINPATVRMRWSRLLERARSSLGRTA